MCTQGRRVTLKQGAFLSFYLSYQQQFYTCTRSKTLSYRGSIFLPCCFRVISTILHSQPKIEAKGSHGHPRTPLATSPCCRSRFVFFRSVYLNVTSFSLKFSVKQQHIKLVVLLPLNKNKYKEVKRLFNLLLNSMFAKKNNKFYNSTVLLHS